MKEKTNKNIQFFTKGSIHHLAICSCVPVEGQKKVQNFSRSFKFANDGKSNDGDITEELTTKAGSTLIIYNNIK